MSHKIVVRIKNFRSYTVNPNSEDGFFQFEFHQGVNLLKGSSGVGKSTVFMAVSWCLFKKPAIGNTPLYGGNKETVVSVLIEDQILVTRTNPKTLFTVTLLDRNETLENEEAQFYIHQLYGKEHVWKTCNYVSQGSINNLINGELSDGQRWEVLYTLAFETNTKNERLTLDILKAELKVRVDDLQRTCQSLEEQLKKERDSRNIRLKRIEDLEMELEKIPTRNHRLVNLDQETHSLLMTQSISILSTDQRVTEDMVEMLEREMDRVKTELQKCQCTIHTLEGEVKQLTDKQKAEERDHRQKLQSVRSTIFSLEQSVHGKERTVQRISKAVAIVNQVYENLRGLREVAQSWRGPEIIQRLIKLLVKISWLKQRNWKVIVDPQSESLIVEVIGHLEEEQSRERLKESLMTMESDLIRRIPSLADIQGSWLESLNFEEVERGVVRRPASCPCCGEAVFIVMGRDGKFERVTRAMGSKLDLSKETIEAIKARDEMKRRLDTLSPVQRRSTDLYDLSVKDLVALRLDIQTWRSFPEGFRETVLKFLPEREVSAKYITELQNYTDVEDVNALDKMQGLLEKSRLELQTLNADRIKVEEIIYGINERYQAIIREKEASMRNLLKDMRSMEQFLHALEDKLKVTRSDRSWWVWMEKFDISSVEEFRSLTEDRKKCLEILRAIDGLKERVDEERLVMEELQTKSSECMTRLNLLSQLQVDLEHVESTVLTDCVSRVSLLTNQFLENAFDSPILVTLVTEKESKTAKSKKHSVGVAIKCARSGSSTMVDRTLDGFSGGETDRISLGFSSAITTYSPFPMLMLDECISSLDTEMKDRVIRALRQQAKMTNKAVVLVCHDAVDGLFDHVCEVA